MKSNTIAALVCIAFVVTAAIGCDRENVESTPSSAQAPAAVQSLSQAVTSAPAVVESAATATPSTPAVMTPSPRDMAKAQEEVAMHYAAAAPAIQEYVLWTASTFGRDSVGLWLNEDAFAALSDQAREQKIQYLLDLFKDAEYGRYLCRGLAEASALRDPRLVAPLMKIAGYHRTGQNYDCRPKWMAVAALARQDGDAFVSLLISLVDHGNQNTRNWACAALARKTGQDLGHDKQAWAAWWQAQGHPPLDPALLASWDSPDHATGLE